MEKIISSPFDFVKFACDLEIAFSAYPLHTSISNKNIFDLLF
jgi:hypothetical protein